MAHAPILQYLRREQRNTDVDGRVVAGHDDYLLKSLSAQRPFCWCRKTQATRRVWRRESIRLFAARGHMEVSQRLIYVSIGYRIVDGRCTMKLRQGDTRRPRRGKERLISRRRTPVSPVLSRASVRAAALASSPDQEPLMLHALYFGRAKTDTAADYSLTQVPRQITKDYYLVLSKYDSDQSFMCHLAQGWSGSFRGCVDRWQTDIVARLIIPILPCSSTVYRQHVVVTVVCEEISSCQTTLVLGTRAGSSGPSPIVQHCLFGLGG